MSNVADLMDSVNFKIPLNLFSKQGGFAPPFRKGDRRGFNGFHKTFNDDQRERARTASETQFS